MQSFLHSFIERLSGFLVPDIAIIFWLTLSSVDTDEGLSVTFLATDAGLDTCDFLVCTSLEFCTDCIGCDATHPLMLASLYCSYTWLQPSITMFPNSDSVLTDPLGPMVPLSMYSKVTLIPRS